MKSFLKGKVATVIIILATVILAGVAVFTALRLYQLRQQPVAPNVPSSMPRAQEAGSCSLSFTLTASPSAVVCTSKTAYKDVDANSAGSYDFTAANLLPTDATVSAGQKIVYAITVGPADTTKSIAITDTLPTDVTFVDSDTDVCTYTDSTRKVSCTLSTTNTKAAFRVSVESGATGLITNTASVQGAGDQPSTCSVGIRLPGATETSTPASTSTPAPGATPNSCGGTCGSNFNCASNLSCYQGYCRNPDCPLNSNCVCGGTSTSAPASTPSAPSLPESGTDWPTLVGTGLGILVIIGSVLLAL